MSLFRGTSVILWTPQFSPPTLAGRESNLLPSHQEVWGRGIMIDLKRLERTRLRRTPWGQLLTANLGMRPNFGFLPGVEIVVEGWENLPEDQKVIFALNHTDRYNPWPFQFTLYRKNLGYTVTWVKAKYYESWFIGGFMSACNNIPLPPGDM